MCGIAGLIHRDGATSVGSEMTAMLQSLRHRGPDSTGFAIYGVSREAEYVMRLKLAEQEDFRRDHRIREKIRERKDEVEARLAELGAETLETDKATDYALRYRLRYAGDTRKLAEEIERIEGAEVLSFGSALELVKDLGDATQVADQYGLGDFKGTHGIGHTRMATESRVTTEGSHPFSTGFDLCLVHNGSLSNHNRLRENLRREGIEFQTENDTEVAAGYLTWRLREGATLEQALEGCLTDLDGFYTFAVGTADGFAVLRDPIACKPAVLAETDEWVAMSSEWRSIAVLPGAAEARAWEPEPGVIYAWEKTPV